MKLYLVRHGETDWNKERKIQGRTDIPLNEFGRMLARKTAAGLSLVNFDICYTSPLCRARETAEIIRKERLINIIEDDRIIEMSFGAYEGKCCSPQACNVPENFHMFIEDPQRYKAPEGGENFEDVIKRTGAFWDMLYDQYESGNYNILVATHGAALAALLNNIKKQSLSGFWGMGVHKNCAVTQVEVKNHIPVIVSENRVYYDDYVESWDESNGGNKDVK